jgi:hypothetical protein
MSFNITIKSKQINKIDCSSLFLRIIDDENTIKMEFIADLYFIFRINLKYSY